MKTRWFNKSYVTWLIVTGVFILLIIIGCRGVEYWIAYLTFTGGLVGYKIHYDWKNNQGSDGGVPPAAGTVE